MTFPFTNLSGSRLRPAIVFIENDLDITVCFITTQTSRQEETDFILKPNSTNGIKKESLVRTGKIATIDKNFAKGLLGRLSKSEIAVLNENLKIVLQLS
ncbi:type II toxin-antitoxin system PemK/MazF family toxin [Flavobacterium sp.]|uniref:type II toxin-antitoxin system PemK/MazF family toxin n=1 Tax=Flavobacterium sp. TaxID=239 RepID=UPI003B9B27E5